VPDGIDMAEGIDQNISPRQLAHCAADKEGDYSQGGKLWVLKEARSHTGSANKANTCGTTDGSHAVRTPLNSSSE